MNNIRLFFFHFLTTNETFITKQLQTYFARSLKLPEMAELAVYPLSVGCIQDKPLSIFFGCIDTPPPNSLVFFIPH